MIKIRKKPLDFVDLIAKLYPEFSRNAEDGEKISTKVATFQVTDACNLACTYCYQINKGHHKMPFEVAKKFIDKLLKKDSLIENYMESEESPGVILEFIGGEPLLEIDLID
mgnify:CR=1 FL=1